ncbi:MAG TPA: hypothetical protein VGC54_04180 [Planctomycetota bacterium]
MKGETLFFILLAGHAVLCVMVLASFLAAWRARGTKSLRWVHVLQALVATGYAGLVLVFFTRPGWQFVRNLIASWIRAR